MEKKTAEQIWKGDIPEHKHIAILYSKYGHQIDAMSDRIREYGDRRVWEYSSLQSEEKDKEIELIQSIMAQQLITIERLREALKESKEALDWHLENSKPCMAIYHSDFFNITANAITQADQALSNQPIESDKDRRIKELEEACTELNRFIPELRYLSKSGFQYPDNAIKALTQIEKLLTHN